MCGVSDLKTLDEETHQLGLHNLQPTLLALDGKTNEEKMELFGSAIPLLIRGDADPVVPIAQGEDIRQEVGRNSDVKMVVHNGKGRMFKHGDNVKKAVPEGEEW
ncbi:hypothetical protein NEUTE2DRAFT_56242 [Neurospora tetrasperma FGSC 2509]|nr:hypothetical protein NEUTE2DRAFT_56242 [Neurospora tetrasperma FGSC 2509]